MDDSHSSLPSALSPALDQAYQLVTEEEFQTVVEKLQHFAQQPVGNLAKDDELYLEQQLSDLFGFEVLAEMDGFRLPHTVGVMSARQHLRRHPDDVLAHSQPFPEAGLAQRRSAFGWFTEMGQLTERMIAAESYTVSFPAEFLPGWNEQPDGQIHLRDWLKFRKVFVINPMERRAAVAVIGDTGPYQELQSQFGGSPELIRQLRVWSLPTQGKVLVFFVRDEENTIPLGVRSFAYDRR